MITSWDIPRPNHKLCRNSCSSLYQKRYNKRAKDKGKKKPYYYEQPTKKKRLMIFHVQSNPNSTLKKKTLDHHFLHFEASYVIFNSKPHI